MKKLLYLIIPCLVASCGAKKETPEKNAILGTTTNWVSSSNDYAPFFDINSYSEHAEYGISEKYPVFVGGFKEKVGPTHRATTITVRQNDKAFKKLALTINI